MQPGDEGTEETVVTDEQLTRDVSDELHWDPRVDNRAIAVFASAGVVTLRGTVSSPWERHEAKRAAQRVRGVLGVQNQLEVRLVDDDRREDADLRGDVLQALMLDLRVPTSVDARVKDGEVTLTGLVDWWYQREEAELVARNVPGVTEVQNHIRLNPPTVRPDAADVEIKIRSALARDARLDADAITVTTSDTKVTLSGTVHSWDEHKAALDAAWAAPGVQVVIDQLTVSY
jgi:osmotically-inducible protein OsmY